MSRVERLSRPWKCDSSTSRRLVATSRATRKQSPRDDKLHSDICNVGRLELLEKLKVFRVNKKSEGFEPKQLEPLTKLRELGICNLEKICTEGEADQAELVGKNCLRRLTLDWDSKQPSVDPGIEAVVLERLQPHGDLQVMCIRGYGGSSCPTWLGDVWDLRELRFKDMARLKEFITRKSLGMLIKLELIGLGSLEKWVFPAEQDASHMFPLLQVLIIRECPKLLGLPFSDPIVSPYWFPKLQELEIQDCPQFLSVAPIYRTGSLRCVKIRSVKLLKRFEYSKSSNGVKLEIEGKGDLHSFDQVLVFSKETCLEKLTLNSCPPLQLKHLLMLTSLKTLIVFDSDRLVGPLGGDVELQLPVEYIRIGRSNGNTGKELTELLRHLPKLSKMEIFACKNIKQLIVGVDLQQTTSATSEMEEDEITTAEEEDDAGVLLFPAHLCDSLRELELSNCRELILVDPPTLVPGGGVLQALRSLQRLSIVASPKCLSAFSFSRHLFPSSLQVLELTCMEGMGTLELLSNLSSLTTLYLCPCGEDLKCQGLQSLTTTGGQLNKLDVFFSPVFFAGWDLNPRRALGGGEEQQAQLQELRTDDTVGLLAAPICSFLSASLTKLALDGRFSKGMERFSKEQEDALQLLSSLQKLKFSNFDNLQQLPAGLHNLTSLKKLSFYCCLDVLQLPNDGLPSSLQELDVKPGCSEELKQQCWGWKPSQKS